MGKTVGSILSTALQVAAFVVAPYAYVAVDAVVGRSSAVSTASIAGYLGLGPNLPKPDTTATAIKTPIPPRVAAYGRARLYGAYILYTTASNGAAVDVYAIHETGGVPIDGFEGVYLGDKLVGTGPGIVAGLPDGSYGSAAVEIDLRLGAETETAFSQLVALLPGIWTTDHRGDGVVTGMVTWAPVQAKDYQEIYPNQQPPLSVVARWQRVFDWRDDAQSVDDPSTWAWSENAWLHTAHYTLVREKAERQPDEMFPSGAALQEAWDRYFVPQLGYWTAAADDADDPIDLKAGGTEPRYRSCVAHKLTDAHKATKARILACCDGWIAVMNDGSLLPRSGRYYAPTVAIGPDEIVSYSWQDGIEDENAINSVAVSYISAAHDFNAVDTDSWEDDDDIVARGDIKSTTLSNDVPSNGQARRLAKRTLAKAMAPQRGTVTTNSGGRAVRGERFVNLDIEEAGAVFYSGPAEITGLTRNLQSGGVTFSWVAADPNVDAWNPATEEGDPAPVGDSVAIEPLEAPEIISASADFSDVGSSDGETGSTPVSGARVLITATGIEDRPDLTWYARWRVGTSGSWSESEYSDADPGPGVTLKTGFVPLVSNLNVEVAYSTGDGRASPWSDPEVVDTTA